MAATALPRWILLCSALALFGCRRDKDADDSGAVGVDADGDGYDAGSDPGEDCDDDDAAIHPDAAEDCDGVDDDCDGLIDDGFDGTTWYADLDGDDYGDDGDTVEACGQPVGYVAEGGDCDDGDTAYHPNATEDDCTDPNDYNCDGSVGYADADGDHFPACLECDDSSATVYPRAEETCNGVDDDCDGDIDDAATDAATWYIDYDTDGYGSDRYELVSCEQPAGFVDNDDDCNDANDDAFPGGDEICDGIDNNCDGAVDEDTALDASTWYLDDDGDGYGVPETTTLACAQPDGYADNPDDCDDGAADVSPGIDEICDDLDDDCDGEVDEDDALDASTWWADADGDGYGLDDFTTVSCSHPANYADQPGDCYDDGTTFGASINPDAAEMCDGYDNNCDGDVDEDSAGDAGQWYADADDDGYGASGEATWACAQPDGYVDNTDDCQDDDPDINPGASEICNDGVDSNCDDAPVPCTMSISDADTILYGEEANSLTGSSAGIGGDLNGDGFQDILFGAYRYDTSSASDVGKVYADFGPVSAGERSVSTSDVQILGEGLSGNDDRAGTSVSGGGDLDGDGYDDLMIGAMRFTQTRKSQRGAMYGLLGPVSGSLSLATDYDFRLVGENQFDRIGIGVVSDADLDGDGNADIAFGGNGYDVGASDGGVVYIQLGAFAATTTDFNVASADITLYGEGALDALGSQLATIPDSDGDGLSELLIGNKPYDGDAGVDAGCVYLVNDADLGETAVSDMSQLVSGEAAGDGAGGSVSSAGDINDDGYADLLVGAPNSDESDSDAGKAYLLYGPVTITSLADADVDILGVTANDAFGIAVGGGGDNDSDGVPDLLFGAPGADDGTENGGTVYLFLGDPGAGAWSASAASAQITGDTADTNLGSLVMFSGDTDGSGNDDLMLGANNDDRGGSSAGALFLFNEVGL